MTHGFTAPWTVRVFTALRLLGLCIFCLCALAVEIHSQSESAEPSRPSAFVVEDPANGELIVFGKDVVLRGGAKNVLVFGGDIFVEGNVSEDVATVGGSVVQAASGFIGGDVFALGGGYRSEAAIPNRNPGSETLVYAGYEEEIREMVLNPATMLSPAVTWAFVAQRVLSVLFWFVLTLGVNTVAPGAVGRAVSRFRLSPLKIVGVGLSGFAAVTAGFVLALGFLPGYLGTVAGLMVLALLLVSYIFGRAALQVAFGKILQGAFLPDTKRSETLSVMIGVTVWTVLLSVPYLWTAAFVVLFSASLGLVVTAGFGGGWRVVEE